MYSELQLNCSCGRAPNVCYSDNKYYVCCNVCAITGQRSRNVFKAITKWNNMIVSRRAREVKYNESSSNVT